MQFSFGKGAGQKERSGKGKSGEREQKGRVAKRFESGWQGATVYRRRRRTKGNKSGGKNSHARAIEVLNTEGKYMQLEHRAYGQKGWERQGKNRKRRPGVSSSKGAGVASSKPAGKTSLIRVRCGQKNLK